MKAKRLAANPAQGCRRTCPARRRAVMSTCPPTTCTGWPTNPANTARWCWCWPTAAALGRGDRAAGARRRVSAAAVVGVGERRAARRRSRGGADQGPQGPLGAGARVRARRAVGAMRGQGSGDLVFRAGRRVPAAAEVDGRMVRVGGEARRGAGDHAARPYGTPARRWLCRRGSTCWRCNGCSGTRRRRSRWTPTRTCSTTTWTRWRSRRTAGTGAGARPRQGARAVRVTARSDPSSETGLRRGWRKPVRPPQPGT